MAGSVAVIPKFQFSDESGKPLAGGTLETYLSGTTTPAATYQDKDLTIANPTTINLDAAGECTLWLPSSTVYKFVLKDALGVTRWTTNDINANAADLSGPNGVDLVGGAARAVDSIAALRALPATSTSTVFVTGYYAALDGGGGPYRLDPTDTATADNGGTVIVASDGGRWKLVNTANGVSVRQFGAIGDGVTDDTTAIQAATHAADIGGRVYLPAGDFIGNVDATTDIMFEGPGRLFDASNVQRSTYAEPRSRAVIGQEYLWAFHQAILGSPPGTNLQIVFTGDSTTYGAFNGGTLPEPYRIHNLNDAQLNRYGLYGPVSINSGVNGMQCREWVQTGNKLDQDIAAYPNMALYVIRLGLNDGSIGYRDIDDFRTSIRTGLARLRAWKSAANLSIILMSPNSTSETGYRDEAWNEQVSLILKKAARDYQCCFVDTYAMWRDSRGSAITHWLDDDGNGGSGIHPDGVFNHWIMNLFGEVVYGPLAIRTAATNTFINAPGLGTRLVTALVIPDSFVKGVSIFRTDLPLTFPIDGCVIVTKHADGIVRQENIGFINDIDKKTYTRYAIAGAAWSDWRGLDVSVSPSAGWSIYDAGTPYPTYRKSTDNTVHLSGRVKNPTAIIGSEIMVLPVGYRPETNKRFPVYNWAGTVYGTLQVGADGGVVYVSGDATDITFNFSFQAFQ